MEVLTKAFSVSFYLFMKKKKAPGYGAFID